MKNLILIFSVFVVSTFIFSCNVSKMNCPDYTKNDRLRQHANHLKKIRKTNEPSLATAGEITKTAGVEEYPEKNIVDKPAPSEQIVADQEQESSGYLTASTKNGTYLDVSPEKKIEAEKIFNSLSERQKKKLKKLQTKIERKSDTKDLAQRASGDINGLAIASFVSGIVGLFVFGFILGALAIIFGAIGLTKIKSTGQAGKGLATAGLILGIIDIIALLIILA